MHFTSKDKCVPFHLLLFKLLFTDRTLIINGCSDFLMSEHLEPVVQRDRYHLFSYPQKQIHSRNAMSRQQHHYKQENHQDCWPCVKHEQSVPLAP